MAKVYGILSGKGGVGKTTSAINLAAALNLLGEDVILVDANFSTPNIGLHFGAPLVPITLSHVLADKAEIHEAIYEHDSGIKILPSSLSIDNLKKINPDELLGITKKLKKLADHIILDSAPGLSKEAESTIKSSDEIIIITQPEMPCVTDALKTLKLAEQYDKDTKGFILTRHRNKKTEMPLSNICDMLEITHLGTVPEDKNMQKALFLKDAILHTHPRSKASKAYKKITEKILGPQYMKQIGKQKKESLYKKLLDSLGLR